MGEVITILVGKNILIGAGGTGGHVYPALAVAERLITLGAHVDWLGTQAGIEAELVPAENIDLHTIFVQGVRGHGLLRLLKAPLTILSAVRQAVEVIKATNPDAFVGFGGFASGPGALAARLCNIPVIIHEQNAAMGMTNKLVSLWAQKVLLAFPIAKKNNKKNHTIVGNPIRPSINDIAPPCKRIREHAPFRVLVMGGSQGAQAINEAMPAVVGILRERITLTHQTGKANYRTTQSHYEASGLLPQIKLIEFIDNIDEVYANTDLLIARAGALTVSEAASAGIAAIFIPLPNAVDDHQNLNAMSLVRHGAAKIIDQADLNPEHLANTLNSLLDSDTLLSMSEKARKHNHAKALPFIVKAIAEVIDDH